MYAETSALNEGLWGRLMSKVNLMFFKLAKYTQTVFASEAPPVRSAAI
jgi:hypothetical protein